MKDCNKYMMFFCLIYIITIIMVIRNISIYSYAVFFIIPFYMTVTGLVSVLLLIKKKRILRMTYIIISIIFYFLFVLNAEFNLFVWSGAIAIPLLCSWVIAIFTRRKKVYIEFWGLYFNFFVSILSVLFFWLTNV